MSGHESQAQHYADNPLEGRSIIGISRSKLACNVCGEDATRFAVIRRKWHHGHHSGISKVVRVTIGFYCDECAGDVDELAITGEPI